MEYPNVCSVLFFLAPANYPDGCIWLQGEPTCFYKGHFENLIFLQQQRVSDIFCRPIEFLEKNATNLETPLVISTYHYVTQTCDAGGAQAE